jgi:heme-degrading monooxygenase HmoA
MSRLALRPEPPYVAVIFASQRSPTDDGYGPMGDRMEALAQQQPGFLGVESARGADGFGITVSYWRSEADVAAWKAHPEHREAQRLGYRQWYDAFATRVAQVTRQHVVPLVGTAEVQP